MLSYEDSREIGKTKRSLERLHSRLSHIEGDLSSLDGDLRRLADLQRERTEGDFVILPQLHKLDTLLDVANRGNKPLGWSIRWVIRMPDGGLMRFLTPEEED